MGYKTIILAGGFGKRLAPLSTEDMPKQFLDLTGSGKSLFQETIERALQISDAQDIFPVVNLRHIELVEQQTEAYPEIRQNLVYETEQRNTAYAIALGMEQAGEGIIIAMPSDHYIQGSFEEDVHKAAELAVEGKIVAFGIVPETPDSNFGYLYQDGFHEKPEPYIAEKLVDNGAMWNSGIFIFDAETVYSEFEKFFGPGLGNIPPISFDKAIMEKTNKLAIVEAGFKWADMGSFAALDKYSKAV